MLPTGRVSVVLLPSSASHFARITPPTPLENGRTTTSLGLLSLNEAKKPQTTGAFVVGVSVADAWMCAAIKMSLTSAV